jgi:hypothetical protein
VGGGFIPSMNLTWGGGYPHVKLQGNKFFGKIFSGFENLMTLHVSVILRHLEAELSILRCLKLKKNPFFVP